MARKQVIFWLDDSDPLQADMLAYLQQLKQERAFAPTIRSALMLTADLREKRVTELEKQFPFIATYYRDEYRQQPPVVPDPDTQKRIMLLEQAILQQNTIPSGLTMRPAQLPASNSNPTQSKQPPAPKAADDLIEVKRAKDDQKSGWNALISMAALQGDFSSLPADVLAYGQEIGRIPASHARTVLKPSGSKASREPARLPMPKADESSGIKQLADCEELRSPTFDDLDLVNTI